MVGVSTITPSWYSTPFSDFVLFLPSPLSSNLWRIGKSYFSPCSPIYKRREELRSAPSRVFRSQDKPVRERRPMGFSARQKDSPPWFFFLIPLSSALEMQLPLDNCPYCPTVFKIPFFSFSELSCAATCYVNCGPTRPPKILLS